MRDVTIRALDDRDRELIEALEGVGMNRNAATIIVYLASIPEVTSKALEVGCDLRQPEVSIAMRTLKEHNWVKETEIKREGKGRPKKVYNLSATIDDVIRHYEDEMVLHSKRITGSIQRLKELATS